MGGLGLFSFDSGHVQGAESSKNTHKTSPFLLLLLLFLEHYSPLWNLASNKTLLYFFRSPANSCQFLIPFTFRYS